MDALTIKTFESLKVNINILCKDWYVPEYRGHTTHEKQPKYFSKYKFLKLNAMNVAPLMYPNSRFLSPTRAGKYVAVDVIMW